MRVGFVETIKTSALLPIAGGSVGRQFNACLSTLTAALDRVSGRHVYALKKGVMAVIYGNIQRIQHSRKELTLVGL